MAHEKYVFGASRAARRFNKLNFYASALVVRQSKTAKNHGANDGANVGAKDGAIDGALLGAKLGANVGAVDGVTDGE